MCLLSKNINERLFKLDDENYYDYTSQKCQRIIKDLTPKLSQLSNLGLPILPILSQEQ